MILSPCVRLYVAKCLQKKINLSHAILILYRSIASCANEGTE